MSERLSNLPPLASAKTCPILPPPVVSAAASFDDDESVTWGKGWSIPNRFLLLVLSTGEDKLVGDLGLMDPPNSDWATGDSAGDLLLGGDELLSGVIEREIARL